MRIMSRYKCCLERHLLAIVFSLLAIALALFSSFSYYSYFWDKIQILFQNGINYFLAFFGTPKKTSQIFDLISSADGFSSVFPIDFGMFFSRLGLSFRVLVSDFYLISKILKLMKFFSDFSIVLSFLAILIPFALILKRQIFKGKPFARNEVSKTLRIYRRIDRKVRPVFRKIRAAILNAFQDRIFRISLLVSLALYFNLINVALSFLTYYLYFISTFDFSALWQIVLVLVAELAIPFAKVPLWIDLIAAYFLFCRWRKHLAEDILRHHDAINCGVVKGTGVMIQINGAPGSGKTLLQTDMAITCEMLFRQQAEEIMNEVRGLFPEFRFDLFRKKLDLKIAQHRINNFYDCDLFVRGEFKGILSSFDAFADRNLYFDSQKHSPFFFNGLHYETLIDDLSDYAKAYFVYQSKHPLILSNYPIRGEYRPIRNEHALTFDYDWFRREASDLVPPGYSKIVDYDMLRLMKSKVEDNPHRNIPIAYVFALTELGKERGNALENAELKKNVPETNAKNDGFNDYLRVARHPATIRHRLFVKIFFDEQRASSCGVALSGITEDILTIDKSGTKTKSAMYFYYLRLLGINFFRNLSSDFFRRYERVRNDQTLLTEGMNFLSRASNRAYIRYVNSYSYKEIRFYKQNGTLPENESKAISKGKYYLAFKKIYDHRYASDSLKGFFDAKSTFSPLGIADLPAYSSLYADVSEIAAQNSYFGDSIQRQLDHASAVAPKRATNP